MVFLLESEIKNGQVEWILRIGGRREMRTVGGRCMVQGSGFNFRCMAHGAGFWVEVWVQGDGFRVECRVPG